MKPSLLWLAAYLASYMIALTCGFTVGRHTGIDECAVYIDEKDEVHLGEDLSAEDHAELYRSMITNRWRKKPVTSRNMECPDGSICYGDIFKKDSK